MGRVVTLAEHRGSRNGRSPNGTGHVILRRWDVDVTATLWAGQGDLPATACVHWTIHVEPLRPRGEIAIVREGWQHSQVFQVHDRKMLRIVHELLAASFGVSP